MLPLHYILALGLLTAHPETEAIPNSAECFADLVPTLKQLATSMEILDPRESKFVLARKEEFHADITMLRRRFHDLVDAPPLNDCMRFPPRNIVTDFLDVNRAYRKHLENCRMIDSAFHWEVEETLAEVDRLHQLWEEIRDCRCDYYYVTRRRQSLKRARDTMGYENFYNGTYPPHVPLWRFAQVD